MKKFAITTAVLSVLAPGLIGCAAKKPRRFDTDVRYRIIVFTKTCKLQPDGSNICKAKFDPLEIKAK